MIDFTKKTVLHLTPHLGGGVGRVVLNYLSRVNEESDYIHSVVCLDYANDNAKAFANKYNFNLTDNLCFDHKKLLNAISNADIFFIHWWNHPLLFDFLVREKLPSTRIIVWSHISGLHSPNRFTEPLLQYPDVFVFTTPISYKAEEIKSVNNAIKEKFRVVWSTGGVDHVKNIIPQKHDNFTIGYIGTVDYGKLHCHFINMCKKISIPNVKFIVCGGNDEKSIQKEIESKKIDKNFVFTGWVDDIAKYLSIFDVFGYPLAPYHFGTCDQTLAESMAAGVPPVVLANKMEEYMVEDGVTGIVASDEIEYVKAIEKLYLNDKLRLQLSKNAREHAVNRFSLNNMINDWEMIYNEVMLLPKKERCWEGCYKGKDVSPSHVFLESLGPERELFELSVSNDNDNNIQAIEKIKELGKKSNNWKSQSKGTVHQYLSFFGDDTYLQFWSSLMDFNNK